jgi:hypothetical protein
MIILVLGVLSIIGCCFYYGAPGITIGIIVLLLANYASKNYMSNPEKFTENSYKNMNAGKVCAMIAIVMSVIYLIFTLWMINKFGMDTLSDPELLQERLQELFPNV